MMARTAILALALLFVAGLATLTIASTARDGVSVLTVASLLVLALMLSAIIGVVRNPPGD